jgi:hypothetical protein
MQSQKPPHPELVEGRTAQLQGKNLAGREEIDG